MGTKKFSSKQSFTKTNVGKVPKDKPVVYKLKNSKGENLYTGVAKKGRAEDRLKEHLPGGPDPKSGAKSFQIKQTKSIDQAKREEKKIIKQENPKLNK